MTATVGDSEITRTALYAAFVLGVAITLLTSKSPRSRGGRRVAIFASLTATFLMVGLGFLPAGPVLWNRSAIVSQVGLALTVIGAALALTAFLSLGSNFSIAPESRDLVVTGPYRLMRHPIYFAELLMILGIVVGYARLTALVGALGVMGLQIYRIQAEEQLLRDNFSVSFADFTARTHYRLVPLLW
jgi:protein-S-isoprenylcysteine O-methyltransferase Ste14